MSSGAQLLSHLLAATTEARMPKLVLTDIYLQGLTSLEVSRQAARAGCTSMFIFMSMFNDDDCLDEALACGPVGVFKKPFDISALMDAVKCLVTL